MADEICISRMFIGVYNHNFGQKIQISRQNVNFQAQIGTLLSAWQEDNFDTQNILTMDSYVKQ